jgi:AcrR family transcriptional regulator
LTAPKPAARPDNLPDVASRGARARRERSGDLGPLPGGHHGLTREQILESQRERLLAAVAHEVAARGYRATTITEVVKLASVSTRDFYEHFEGKEDCFLAAFNAVRDHLEQLLAAAAAEQPDWPHQVIGALRAALDFFAAEPDLARLCLVEPVSATPTIAIRFREVVLACVPALARGREELADGASLPASTEDSLVGGIVSLATRSILAGETEKLPALLPDLAEFTLSPYVGADRASKLARQSRAA